MPPQPWPPGPGAAPPPPGTDLSEPALHPARSAARRDRPRRTAAIPARAEQIRRYEEASSRQQAELDRMVAQSRRAGLRGHAASSCSAAATQSQQCVDLNRQISSMRGNLDRINVDLQRLRGGDTDRGEQRRSVMVALAQNNCGPQYRTAARAPGGFFDQLFGARRRSEHRRRSRQSASAERELPHGLRAHLRRILFPDFLRDLAARFRRTRRPASACARPPR